MSSASQIHDHEEGGFSLQLQPCTAEVVRFIVPPDESTVWVRGHLPNPIIQWWRARVPLSPSGRGVELSVRDIRFDFQAKASDFLRLLPELEDAGMQLLHMGARVPDTLTLDNLHGSARWRALVANHLISEFCLPHANEFAVLRAPSREHLEALLRAGLPAQLE